MDLKNLNYSNLIFSIAFLFAARVIYDKYKLNVQKDDRVEELNIIKKYLLNERDNYAIEQLSSIKKPIIWVPIQYDLNARKWASFGSRNSTDLNQDYLYLTIRSIINRCGEDFHVVLIDDDSFGLILEDWTIDLSKLGEAQKAYFRLLGLVKVLYKYGGIAIEPSFIVFKSLKPIHDKILDSTCMCVAEFPDKSVNSHMMAFMPSTKFMGCLKGCDQMHAFDNHLQILFSKDYTNGINMENQINKWLFTHARNGHINYIDGAFIGTKDGQNKTIDLERLLSSHYLDLNRKTYALYVPREDLLKRHCYNWFANLNTREVLESNTNIGKYCR